MHLYFHRSSGWLPAVRLELDSFSLQQSLLLLWAWTWLRATAWSQPLLWVLSSIDPLSWLPDSGCLPQDVWTWITAVTAVHGIHYSVPPVCLSVEAFKVARSHTPSAGLSCFSYTVILHSGKKHSLPLPSLLKFLRSLFLWASILASDPPGS